MNKHISMFDVIQAGAFRNPNMPMRKYEEADDEYQVRVEDRAQTIFFDALAQFRSKVQDAMALTDIEKDSLRYLLDVLDDHGPNRDRWEEKVRT